LNNSGAVEGAVDGSVDVTVDAAVDGTVDGSVVALHVLASRKLNPGDIFVSRVV
jgi:predicted lipid carrier protein YhbT